MLEALEGVDQVRQRTQAGRSLRGIAVQDHVQRPSLLEQQATALRPAPEGHHACQGQLPHLGDAPLEVLQLGPGQPSRHHVARAAHVYAAVFHEHEPGRRGRRNVAGQRGDHDLQHDDRVGDLGSHGRDGQERGDGQSE